MSEYTEYVSHFTIQDIIDIIDDEELTRNSFNLSITQNDKGFKFLVPNKKGLFVVGYDTPSFDIDDFYEGEASIGFCFTDVDVISFGAAYPKNYKEIRSKYVHNMIKQFPELKEKLIKYRMIQHVKAKNNCEQNIAEIQAEADRKKQPYFNEIKRHNDAIGSLARGFIEDDFTF